MCVQKDKDVATIPNTSGRPVSMGGDSPTRTLAPEGSHGANIKRPGAVAFVSHVVLVRETEQGNE
jgi:hypothetical protein